MGLLVFHRKQTAEFLSSRGRRHYLRELEEDPLCSQDAVMDDLQGTRPSDPGRGDGDL